MTLLYVALALSFFYFNMHWIGWRVRRGKTLSEMAGDMFKGEPVIKLPGFGEGDDDG